MIETFHKLTAFPAPVWIGPVVFVAIFVVFVRATDLRKVKGDYKVSKPERSFANGSPYLSHRHWTHPADDQRERLPEDPADRNFH